MIQLTGPTSLLPGWSALKLSKGIVGELRGCGKLGGCVEAGRDMEVLASMALVTLFPKQLCKGNSPGWLEPPLG